MKKDILKQEITVEELEQELEDIYSISIEGSSSGIVCSNITSFIEAIDKMKEVKRLDKKSDVINEFTYVVETKNYYIHKLVIRIDSINHVYKFC